MDVKCEINCLMDVKCGVWLVIWICMVQISEQRAIDLIIEDVETSYKNSTKDDLASKLPSKVWHEYALQGRTEELVKLQLDMIITKDTYQDIIDSTEDLPERRKRNAVKDVTRLWPRRIPYIFKDGFSIEEKYKIVMAMNHWEEHTCLEFVEAKHSDFDVIEYIRVNDVCESMVGRARGPQPINLAEPCLYQEVLVHEIGHALGLYHEHMRADRDNYVIINYENIDESRHLEFDKLLQHGYSDYGKPYDYESIMHYGKLFFSKNRNAGLLTIVPRDPKYVDVIGEVTTLSFSDIKIVNEMYRCSEGCADKFCPDDGFLGKNCQCYCVGETTQDVVSCQPKSQCGVLDIDLKLYNVYTAEFQTEIKTLDREHYPDGTLFLVEHKDLACGEQYTNFTCDGGEWNGELPECVREKDCVYDDVNGDIFLDVNGYVLQPGGMTKSRSEVRVFCKKRNAKLKDGEDHVTCQDGVWGKQLSAISCITEHPLCPMVINAALSGTFETGLQVMCLEGYELEGGQNRFSCSWNGTWKPYRPVCKPAGCRVPKNDKGLQILYDSQGAELMPGSYVTHGSNVSVWCPRGHVPDDLVLGCNYGKFSVDIIPECRLVTCAQPPAENVEYIPKKVSYQYGDDVRIGHCDKMLEFVGSRILLCQKDGQWSDRALCREFCKEDQVVFETLTNMAFQKRVWNRISGVSSYQACERTCLHWQSFLCRAFVFGYEDGRPQCRIYPYNPDEYRNLVEDKQFWSIGVRKCVPDD